MANRAKFAISQALYDRALEQILNHLLRRRTHLTAGHLRSDAKQLLDKALWMVYEYQCENPLQPISPSSMLNNPQVPESTKQILRENNQRMNQQSIEIRRSQLIQLVKYDEMDIATATQLVDEIIRQAA